MNEQAAARKGTVAYASGAYWESRQDMLYYQYFRYIVRCLAAEAASMLDVGSGNAPYLEWFDWIPRRVSVDLKGPYRSAAVEGIEGDIRALDLGERFDLVTCMQVLEHVPEAEPFARRLMELGRLVLVSAPYRWPKGASAHHVHDPVDAVKLAGWFGQAPNYRQVVHEPFRASGGGCSRSSTPPTPSAASARRPPRRAARSEPRRAPG
jgi:SAM-dependent methyltransferase